LEDGDSSQPVTVCDDAPAPASPLGKGQELKIFASTFATIFLAELGDKTQLTTLLMSAESQSPWIVFLGAGSALIATTLLGVLVGRWLSKRMSLERLETIVGGLLLFIAVLLLWDVVQA
jgi:putative Ca2+/H+ antiporter (TMEM165/GDT1 family)